MLKKISDSNVLIVGLARNCESVLEKEIKNISKCFHGFSTQKWLIIESDSDDSTLDVLLKLKKEKIADYISLGNLRNKLPKRTERIAYCRNAYVDAINNNQEYLNIDFVVVVDLDGVNTLLTRSSVESCWALDVDWDACFANQKGPYYDIWALRHEFWSPNDCWQAYEYLISKGINKEKSRYLSVYSRMLTISEKDEPIQVESAFGGLGIYKRRLFINNSYIGLDSRESEICEHVTFHKTIIDNRGNLYINPLLINCGINEHTMTLSVHHKIKRIVKDFMKRMIIFCSRD